MSMPSRVIHVDGGPLPDIAATKVTCELTVDLTDMPPAIRQQLANAMVKAADDFIHEIGIYPMPQLEFALAGTEVPCPRRFHVNQPPTNSGTSFAVERPPLRVPTVSLRVVDTDNVLTVYVDNVLGDDAHGDGTMTKPYRTREAVERMASVRGGVVVMRRPGGQLLGTIGDLPPDPPARPAARPSPIQIVVDRTRRH